MCYHPCIIFHFIVAMLSLPAYSIHSATLEPLSEADFKRVDAYIESQLEEAKIPGVALAVIEGGKVVHLKGFGIADPTGRPVTPETPFILGSISKSFTALAIMQLVESGQIELDTPVRKYLPWFQVADPEASKRITVRHLLNQTSGLPYIADGACLVSRDISDDALEQRVKSYKKLKTTTPVGEQYQYCNANYIILGAVIQTVTGKSYEQYIRQNIFLPLDMRNSYASEEEAKRHNLATGYRYWFGRPRPASGVPYPRSVIPSGFLISCAKDMSQYLTAHMNEGLFRGTRILSKAGTAELHKPGIKPYAMGWMIRNFNGMQIIYHDGSTSNFHTVMAIVPSCNRAYVILVNAENYLSGPDISSLPWNVLSLLLGSKSAQPIRKIESLPDLLMVGCILLVGQIVVLLRAFWVLRRWRKQPELRPRHWSAILWRVILPIVLNIGIVVVLLLLVPRYYEIAFSVLLLFAPDGGWVILLNVLLALVRSLVLIGGMIRLWHLEKCNR
jgi:CubicO group peptidase (beta-lactamase class C family)